MTPYIRVTVNAFHEYFSYRLNFLLWRVRVTASLLVGYFLWLAIFSSNTSLFGYEKSQMLTYMILLSFINGIVLTTQAFRVASDIQSGMLSTYLLQPIRYFLFTFFRDVADKSINTFFSIIEMALLWFLLKPPIFLQSDAVVLMLFFVSCAVAAVLYFEINIILSVLGFWTQETWAARFIFSILVTFLAGTYFPLDIVGKEGYAVLQFLPFTYLVYFPLKLYLGVSGWEFAVRGFFIGAVWMIILWIFMHYLWRQGLKIYTAEGN